MTPISVVIITYNEAHVLAQTLKSVSWADEIVVVDSGSTDGTIKVAEDAGARAYYRAFDGYGSQKCYAVAKASHDWILSIDADEVVSAELADEIQSLFRQVPDCQGYTFPISLVYLGRLLRYSGEYNKRFLRLFNRQAGTFTRDSVHEKVQVKGKVSTLSNRVYHYSFESLAEHLFKIDRYSTAAAAGLYAQGKRATRLKALLRFPLTFFKIYFLRLGILDGYEGFLWAFYVSIYTMTKYTKLVELHQQASVATSQPPYVLELALGK
ncbi:glycosyltransferase family 2 protein [Telluribacter sp.]|jgi:glycosyltransferase involved in cell wall biosynthesis|uniref:glycosyltransferase family 2 protein n=1 Tax=Telluribacter sp. TaxID=1978767 RepID=UPI002E0E51E2|nr:glycosyltransferase family 2 protein [Telluribacter sp.]